MSTFHAPSAISVFFFPPRWDWHLPLAWAAQNERDLDIFIVMLFLLSEFALLLGKEEDLLIFFDFFAQV